MTAIHLSISNERLINRHADIMFGYGKKKYITFTVLEVWSIQKCLNKIF